MRKRANGLRPALVSILAVATSFALTYFLARSLSASAGVALMSAVLTLSFARRTVEARGHAPLVTLVSLPLVALAAGFVGWLLHTFPIAGAVVFVAAIFLSIWLRKFGARASAVGGLIALPVVAVLIVPAAPHAPGGPIVDAALVIAGGLIALGSVEAFFWLAHRLRFLAKPPARGTYARPLRQSSTTKLPVSTRMAVQMAVALSAAFTIGLTVFREHWPWIVLTAFIVCSGSRGRGDAAYKGLLRLGGALAGTLAAFALQRLALPGGVTSAVLIFAVLFVAIWLRQISYAYWAAAITLILALLQGSAGMPSANLLGMRLVGILIGAMCGVAASWFVYPIRTESVARRWLADVLAVLHELVSSNDDSPQSTHDKRRTLAHVVADSDRISPPIVLHHRLIRRSVDEHPAVWIALVRDIVPHAERFAFDPANANDHAHTAHRTAVAKAIQGARRALATRSQPNATPEVSISDALRRLHKTVVPDA